MYIEGMEESVTIDGMALRCEIMHFEDKVIRCTMCGTDVKIKFNEIGGVWHLYSYKSKSGKVWNGSVCLKCFDVIKES